MKKPKEVWAPVLNKPFDEWYEVSSLGNVRSYHDGVAGNRRKTPNILSPQTSSSGYRYINLRAGRRGLRLRVCTLVIGAFLGVRAGCRIVHLNRDKSDDRLVNLEYFKMTPRSKKAPKSIKRPPSGVALKNLTPGQLEEINYFIRIKKPDSFIVERYGIDVEELNRYRRRRVNE